MTQHWHAAIWPDGTWAWRDEHDVFVGRSDDFIRVAIPEWMGEDDIELFAEKVRAFGWTDRDIRLHILRDIEGPQATLEGHWACDYS